MPSKPENKSSARRRYCFLVLIYFIYKNEEFINDDQEIYLFIYLFPIGFNFVRWIGTFHGGGRIDCFPLTFCFTCLD